MNKQELRKTAKEIRKNLPIEELSRKFVEKIKNLDIYKKSNNIMIYYPLKEEIDLLSLMEDKSKTFYLPKIVNDNLLCCSYQIGDKICVSCFKTIEPSTSPTNKDLIDIVIVPALAVDRNNYRLGYGGGFYDRFLADYKGIKIVCIPEDLIFETIYPEKYDIKADFVIFC